MTTEEFLARLLGMDVRVRAEGASVRCSAPEGILTPALQVEIARRKPEILALLGEDGAGQTQERLRLAPMPREGELPLSFAQRRLWFLDQLEPGTSAYTIAARRRLRGPLDLTALANAFTELVRRHESLRTTFASKNGEPRQQIATPERVTPEIIDLEGVPAVDREQVAEDRVRAEAERPFTLVRGPLFRPVLFRLGPDEHELLVSIHHIVADGWSLGITFQEVDALYKAYAAGRPSPLPELPLQYADFALWQRQWLTGDVLEAQRRYWRTCLARLPAPLELQADRHRPPECTSAGASHDFELPRSLADSLRRLGRREGATLFMTLLAGFKAVLSRYTGEKDIVVGTAVANRTRVELESIVGFFANTLVLRTDLEGDPTFRQLLGRVREASLGAYAHQDMPFEKLVEELQPERKLGQNPLFQVSFVFQGAATGPAFAFVTVASPFDLTLFVRGASEGALRATIEYKRDLFAPETIARLAGHYRTLLEGVAADPDCPLSALPILDEIEAHRLLVEWNATARDYPRDRLVHGLFEDQVDTMPDAVAVAFEGMSLTYRELARRANQLAHHLRTLGVGPNVLVGIFVERSLEMFVAVLAVMKAGGAYAPLDPAYPADRIEFMLQDAKISLVVTQAALLDRVSIPAEARALCLDRDASAIDAAPEENPRGGASADDLAYVIYTSGSTGRPKGVQIAHRSLANVVAAFREALDVRDRDILVALTTLSFDIAALELLLPLVGGAQVVVASRQAAADPDKLIALLADTGATIVQATPATWRMLLEAGWRSTTRLRILCGGEALPPELAARLLATGASVWNVYGPTETTIWSTMHPVKAREGPVPIGRPIANTQTYVVDASGGPVPIGAPGELYIGGIGVAKGYLNRPELTAEKFVPDRFSGRPGARLYRTGDIARYRADGTLEFLGRLDDQVKVRGHRVELGEIEATLACHRSVRAAAVVARPAPDGETRLVAYVVGDGPVDPGDLREFLKSKLPEYMVPAAFVALDRLPLTPNGKVDRRVLPESTGSVELTSVFAEPRDEVERQLVKIWEELLAVNRIGTRDNFFDRGGHSLLAVRMFARLEECLRIRLPLATLFEAPTIEGLAALVRAGTRLSAGRALVAIQPAGSRPPVFAVSALGGNVLCFNDLARLLGPGLPFYGLQSRGLDGSEAPLMRIEDIAAAHLREVREVQPEGPYYLTGLCMGGVVAYEMAQQLLAAGQEIGLLTLLETWPPMKGLGVSLRPRPRALDAVAFVAGRLRLYLQTFARLRRREQLRYLLERVKVVTRIVTERDLSPGARIEFYGDVVSRANLLAYRQYEPRTYPGRVVLFCAAGRKIAAAEDYRLAWRQFTAGGLEVYTAPGEDSGLMLTEPHVRVLARRLKACIERAQPSAATVAPA